MCDVNFVMSMSNLWWGGGGEGRGQVSLNFFKTVESVFLEIASLMVKSLKSERKYR